jgi:microcystin-dependent protein
MRTCTLRLLVAVTIMLTLFQTKTNAQDPYIGEIRMVAFNYAPDGWAKCEGQLLPISQNQALFALLGTTYGGNGQTTFALPDFRGRVPMAPGTGPGLTYTDLGEQQGSETVTLLPSNLPPHTHLMNVYNGSGALDSLTTSSAYLSLIQNPDLSRSNAFSTGVTPNATLNMGTITSPGLNGLPVPNKQPSLSITFIIALYGLWPTP